jgi:protein-disulfide isomerase
MVLYWRKYGVATLGLLVTTVTVLANTAVSAFAQASVSSDQQVIDELRQIRQLLEQMVNQNPAVRSPTGHPTTGEKVTLPDASGYAIGRAEAPVTIVEFTDLQCPFCREFHRTTFDMLWKDYILKGKVRYISRDLPLPVHPLSTMAARAARCAGEQGRFWEMRHAILMANANLSEESFGRLSQELGLDSASFEVCMADTTRFDNDLRKDRDAASLSDITATPTVVVGPTNAGPLVGVRIVGAAPFEMLEATIKASLKESNERP